MPLRIRDLQDFWSGMLFVAAGGAAMFLARNYSFGTADKMGPGYFPTILGGLLVLVGVAAIIRSLGRDGEALKTFHWQILYVVGATALFGLLIRNAGLLAAVAVLVVVSAAASVHFRWRTAVISIVVLMIISVLVFVKGLGLPIPLVGPWLGG